MSVNQEARPKKLKILFMASEADPIVKIGGLGDFTGSLPRILRNLNPSQIHGYSLDVRLALPYHAVIRQSIKNPKLIARFTVPHEGREESGQAFLIDSYGLPIYLIDGPPFRQGDPVYGTDPRQDGERYTFFPLASLETVKQLQWQPDIVHVNDWHTALACYVLKIRHEADPFFARTSSVLTLHNLPFMGAGTQEAITSYGIPASQNPRLPVWARNIPLPLGMEAADKIIPVSPTYAREILTPEFGCDLQEFLKSRKEVIQGILNGLDYSVWDPANDANLETNYSYQNLNVRSSNKVSLLREFSLNLNPDLPLMIIISRLDQQKGIDLAIAALSELGDLPWQAIFLGTGEHKLEESCRQLEKKYPDKVRVAIRFDARLARQMYGGGDILLIPSRYEPCGIAQMIAMRYGCIPLARATGGLIDTIVDNEDLQRSTGFLFKTATVSALSSSIIRAISSYQDQENWRNMQVRAMQQDFSWNRSALAYADAYINLAERNT